jgi:hypothetical protein
MSAFRFPHVYLLVTLVKSDVCYACWVRVSSPFEIALQNGMALGVGVLKEAPRLPETCRGGSIGGLLSLSRISQAALGISG